MKTLKFKNGSEIKFGKVKDKARGTNMKLTDNWELLERLKKLRDDWFEHESGDGFGRATDEELELIANFIAQELNQQKKQVIKEIIKKNDMIHDEFCFARGTQFKECARCLLDRELASLSKEGKDGI